MTSLISLMQSIICYPFSKTPKFDYISSSTGSWLGADSSYSVSLSDQVTLFTFQDSFVGVPSATTRRDEGVSMVDNTIALYNGTMKYYWIRQDDYHIPFFADPSLGMIDRLWPTQGFIANEKLYIPLVWNLKTHNGGDVDVGTPVGTRMVSVDNYLENPLAWRKRYTVLHEGSGYQPGLGVCVVDRYVYFFTPYQNDQILCRLHIKLLDESNPRLEYLMQNKEFEEKVTLEPEKMLKLNIAANSGLSIRFSKYRREFVVIYSDTSTFPPEKVKVAVAKDIKGPYRICHECFQHPKRDFSNGNYSYGGIEHARFSDDYKGQLKFTFTSNNFDFDHMIDDMHIYRPKFRTINLGKAWHDEDL